jgi:hypothetical protein
MRWSIGFDRNATGNGRLAIYRTLVAAFWVALWVGIVPGAEATPISYVFSPGASIQFDDGNIEAITGGFTIDHETSTLTGGPIILTGPEPENDLYDHPSFSGDNSIIFFGSEQLELTFSGPLDGHSRTVVDATYLDFSSSGPPIRMADNGAVGQVVQVVPEPSGLAIIALPLMLFLIARKDWSGAGVHGCVTQQVRSF